MNIITFYSTLQEILARYKDSSITQFDALDAIERLNEEGKALGLMVSPNVILLSNKEDLVDNDKVNKIVYNDEDAEEKSYSESYSEEDNDF